MLWEYSYGGYLICGDKNIGINEKDNKSESDWCNMRLSMMSSLVKGQSHNTRNEEQGRKN